MTLEQRQVGLSFCEEAAVILKCYTLTSIYLCENIKYD